MRLPHRIARPTATVAMSLLALACLATNVAAQVEITPLPTEPPSSELAPGTQWIYWMALGAAVIAVLIVVGVAMRYVRFAPKFFGREEPARRPPPGTRPASLAREAARMRYTPPPAPAQAAAAPAPAPSRAATATAVAERPAPAAQAATQQTTAPPSGEPAAQADAVGQAEAEAPESRPTAKTAEEVGAETEAPAQSQAAAPAPTEQAPAPAEQGAPPPTEQAPAAAPSEPAPAQTPSAPAPATHAGSEMDQQTFDRVLKEQLDRGVDRRVAEGRARAAAVVAARKKAQG